MTRGGRILESFWFFPALLCAVAVVVAESLIAVDRRIGGIDLGPFAVLVTTIGEAGSRDLLGAIAGSVLTVAATSFSITIAVLATTSATYGPRLVRNFMADRGNQVVLGVFTSTFLYSLLVLRSIRTLGDADDVFVPHLAVNVAVLLAVLSIGVLVYFINHIAESVQVSTLSRQVRDDLLRTIDRLFPSEIGTAPPPDARSETPAGLEADGVEVPTPAEGYLLDVLEQRLLAAAGEHDLVVRLRARPGEHLLDGQAVAVLWPPDRVDEDVRRQVGACFRIGAARTPHQDLDLAVSLLEEMAVRALSPSTNDPYTALNALDDLATGLTRLAARPVPASLRYDGDGRLRVIARPVDVDAVLGRVFDAMRHYAVEHPSVLHRTVELAAQVGAAGRPALRAQLAHHLTLLLEAFERAGPQDHDLQALRRHVDGARHSLQPAPARATGAEARTDGPDG